MRPLYSVCVAAALAASALCAAAQSATPSRGELLYGNHCVACHTTQMHWRDKRIATDWASLVAQVRRFQAEAKLGWSDEDIVEVARHLNRTIYKFPDPTRG